MKEILEWLWDQTWFAHIGEFIPAFLVALVLLVLWMTLGGLYILLRKLLSPWFPPKEETEEEAEEYFGIHRKRKRDDPPK